MHIHICIVTGQPMANLIPIMQEKPEHIILLCTPQMQTDSEQFRKTLIFAGWAEDCIHTMPLNEERFDDLHNRATEGENKLISQFPKAQFTYNASGGTKPMALALFDVFKARHRVIYTDTQHHEISVLAPLNHPPEPQKSVISMEVALHAENKLVQSTSSSQQTWQQGVFHRKRLTQRLAEYAASSPKLIGVLNGISHSAIRDEFKHPTSIKLKWDKLQDVLETAEDLGLLEYNTANSVVEFANKDAALYLGGFWLEEYIYQEAQSLDFDEVACGVEIGDATKTQANITNEIDLIITHNNQLLFIECKTSKMDKEAEMIYKLDSLANQAGGTFASMLLISAQPMNHRNRDGYVVDAKARAKNHKIRCAAAAEILNINQTLQRWKDKGSWY